MSLVATSTAWDNDMDMDMNSHSSMTMQAMNDELDELSGDEFDEAFLGMMIAHHEGAVDMAELALERAKHSEIKELSRDIIAAQNKEITDMTAWMMKWNYDNSRNSGMMH